MGPVARLAHFMDALHKPLIQYSEDTATEKKHSWYSFVGCMRNFTNVDSRLLELRILHRPCLLNALPSKLDDTDADSRRLRIYLDRG